jgi:tetratricopeptide (TPR) repeat protein
MSPNEPKRRPARNQPASLDFYQLLRAGTQALQQGKFSRAIELLEQAQQIEPDNADVSLNLAGAYILAKKFKKAVDLLEPLSQRDPQNPMVWTNLGAAYLGNPVLAKDHDHHKAIAAFEKAIEIDASTPNVAYNLGLIHFDRQDWEKARYLFKQAVQTNPQDRDARNYLKKLPESDSDGAGIEE